MRPLALTWVLQKNGLANSNGDAQRGIVNGEVFVDGVRAKDPATRLMSGHYLLQRNGHGEVRVMVEP